MATAHGPIRVPLSVKLVRTADDDGADRPDPLTSGRPTGGCRRTSDRRPTPWLAAFLCLLIPVLPSYLVIAGPLKSNGSPAKLITMCFFGLAVLAFLLIRRGAKTRTLNPGIVIVLTYAFLMLLVYGVGLSRLGSEIAEPGKTRALLIVIADVGAALYFLTRVKTFHQRTLLLGCLAIGLTYNCVVGLLQVTAHVELQTLLQPPGFADNQTDQGRGFAAVLSDRFGAQRAIGTSGHAIEFAVLSAVTVPLALHFARFSDSRQVRLFAALAAGIALLAIPSAVSRSGLIALAAVLLVYVWTFTVRGLCIGLVLGAVALFVNFLVSPGTTQALWQTITNSAQDDSVTGRIAAYVKVSDTFRDHPVFGIGLGANPPREYGFLDNEWLQALVQGGCVGFAGMIVLSAGGVFGIAAALRCANTPRERDQAYAMGAMYTGILATSYTFDLFSYQQAALLFFMLFGLLWSNYTVPFRDTGIELSGNDRAGSRRFV